MAELQRRFVGRWPLAVLAAAGVTAVSLGDVVAGWYALAGQAPSAAGEYPVRIALRQTGPAAGESRPLAQGGPTGAENDGRGSEADLAADAPGDLVQEPSANTLLAETVAVAGSSADGMLAIQFDLADPDRSTSGGSAIEIRKAIRLNGADAGDARIHVDASSSLSIAREELGRLLARSGRQELMAQLISAGRFVSFDEMRRQGIEVRYDPVSDLILVST